MKIILNMLGLLASAFGIWTFKNTPWAATTFLGYLAILVLEAILTSRLHAAAQSVTRRKLPPPPGQRPQRVAAVPARPGQRPASAPRYAQPSPVSYYDAPEVLSAGRVLGELLGTLIFGMALMFLADASLGFKWFEVHTPGQPPWLGVINWFATALSILVAFGTPIIIIFILGMLLSGAWSAKFGVTGSGTNSFWEMFGYVCGFVLGFATYSHIALATIFFNSLH